MIRVSDNPPPGVIDRRDGNTKGECGITTLGCLFCKDQISGSAEYVKNYEDVKFADKGACQIATCPFWGSGDCWQTKIGPIPAPSRMCPHYMRRQRTGSWKLVAAESEVGDADQ